MSFLTSYVIDRISLVILEFNHKMSPLYGFESHSGNAEGLSQDDPGCSKGPKSLTVTLIGSLTVNIKCRYILSVVGSYTVLCV